MSQVAKSENFDLQKISKFCGQGELHSLPGAFLSPGWTFPVLPACLQAPNPLGDLLASLHLLAITRDPQNFTDCSPLTSALEQVWLPVSILRKPVGHISSIPDLESPVLDFSKGPNLPLFIWALSRLIPRQEGAARERGMREEDQVGKAGGALAGCLPSARPSWEFQSGMINKAQFFLLPLSLPGCARGFSCSPGSNAAPVMQRKALAPSLWLYPLLFTASHAPNPFSSGSRPGMGRML